MQAIHRPAIIGSVVIVVAQALAVAALMTFIAVRPAEAATCPPADAPALDARLAARADEGGITAVRQFVTRTRMVYGLDVTGAVARIERHRDDVGACEERAAAATPVVPGDGSTPVVETAPARS